jgi:hypothetical protein
MKNGTQNTPNNASEDGYVALRHPAVKSPDPTCPLITPKMEVVKETQHDI